MRVLAAIAACGVLLGGCGGDESDDAEPAPGVAMFIGELGQSNKTVCAADAERERGTNVITVRDHSRQYDVSVVKYADGHQEEAMALAKRLGIRTVNPMDPVTPTLFPGIDVAAIIAGDYRSLGCRA